MDTTNLHTNPAQPVVKPSDANYVHEETQYLELVDDVINHGHKGIGRGGAATRSLFGKKMEFSLHSDRIPLFTTKRTFFRGVVEELLWMLRGSSDATELSDKGINIWKGHSSREFLDSRGLTDYEVGDIGPLYGYQWRHAGEPYIGCKADYRGKGVDQIANLIDGLHNDQRSRRHVVCAWSASEIDSMALAPCHCMFQMYLDENGLSCLLNQRSADLGLGVPFNVGSYAILTRIIAKCLGVVPHKLIHIIGDAHVYEDHIDALREQIIRKPFEFPCMKINKEISNIDDIENLEFGDFELSDYKHHKKICMKMVI
jgi:thymidylate synthase